MIKPKFKVVKDEREKEALPPFRYNPNSIKGRWGVEDSEGKIVNPTPFSVKEDALAYARTQRRRMRKALK